MIVVILHHARNILIEKRIPISSARSMTLPWHILMELWHRATAHLLADGVPVDRMPIGGPIGLTGAWRSCRHQLSNLFEPEIVPSWKYDISLDSKADIPRSIFQARPTGFDHEDTTPTETRLAVETTQEDSYEWPSESARFDALSSAVDIFAVAGGDDNQMTPRTLELGVKHISPCELGQHHPSTFRVLVHIMRDCHHKVFDVAENAEVPGDRYF